MSHEAPAQLDIGLAHRYFSADCFNRTWALIDRPERSSVEDEAMVLCAMASLWHWTQRPDCTDQNLSIGHWQVSRACALAGQKENAMRHAQRSLALAQGSPAFYVGYGHEALARAALVLGDREMFRSHLKQSHICAAAVSDKGERDMLEQDLRALEMAAGA